jgi:hypothetical protein
MMTMKKMMMIVNNTLDEFAFDDDIDWCCVDLYQDANKVNEDSYNLECNAQHKDGVRICYGEDDPVKEREQTIMRKDCVEFVFRDQDELGDAVELGRHLYDQNEGADQEREFDQSPVVVEEDETFATAQHGRRSIE